MCLTEPVETLAEVCIWIHHPFLLVEEFECHRDEAEEGIDERSIHVDDALRILRENECTILAVSHFVVIVACREIGHFIDVVGKWIIGTGVSLSAE